MKIKEPETAITWRSSSTVLIGLCSLLSGLLLPGHPILGQQIPQSSQIWSAEVIRARGQPVIPLFDGWFTNEDGSRSLCFSYFNLNLEQSLDIPLGELNHLSDTRYEALLPSHFDPLPPEYRHRFCAFTVQVSADFSPSERIIWSLSSAGETLSVPGHILPAYVLDEPSAGGRGDIAPLVRLAPEAQGVRGRKGIVSPETIRTKTGEPVRLQAWIEHPQSRVWVGWTHHRGPGMVAFDDAEYELDLNGEPAAVQASFSAPGEYVINMQTIDDTASFEFYCCHTNVYFTVAVDE